MGHAGLISRTARVRLPTPPVAHLGYLVPGSAATQVTERTLPGAALADPPGAETVAPSRMRAAVLFFRGHPVEYCISAAAGLPGRRLERRVHGRIETALRGNATTVGLFGHRTAVFEDLRK